MVYWKSVSECPENFKKLPLEFDGEWRKNDVDKNIGKGSMEWTQKENIPYQDRGIPIEKWKIKLMSSQLEYLAYKHCLFWSELIIEAAWRRMQPAAYTKTSSAYKRGVHKYFFCKSFFFHFPSNCTYERLPTTFETFAWVFMAAQHNCFSFLFFTFVLNPVPMRSCRWGIDFQKVILNAKKSCNIVKNLCLL